PFTPGYVADQGLANELAEIGVILLMFGVGLHFSLEDLLSVGRIAIPGAIGQIASATLLGMALAWGLGWPMSTGFVFGLALSVASTVVLLRDAGAALARDRARSHRGGLADRRRHRHGLHAGPAAGARSGSQGGHGAESIGARVPGRGHAGQGRGLRRHHADRGQAFDPVDPALCRSYRVA